MQTDPLPRPCSYPRGNSALVQQGCYRLGTIAHLNVQVGEEATQTKADPDLAKATTEEAEELIDEPSSGGRRLWQPAVSLISQEHRDE